MKKFSCVFLVLLCLAGLILVSGCISDVSETDDSPSEVTDNQDKSLIVYCGAGLREPMEEIAKIYEEKEGVVIKYTFGGSAQLLSQMELLGSGDVYMPGARAYIDSAAKKGFIENSVGDSNDVVYHILLIATQKGNPKNIHSLKDLTKEGVNVGIGEPEGNAVGQASKSVLTKNNLWEDMQDNIVVKSGTVNELLVYLKMEQVDAVLIWSELPSPELFDIVNIPLEEGFVKVVPIGKLTFSEKPDEAQKFVDYVSSDEGKEIFLKYNFETYPNPKYDAFE